MVTQRFLSATNTHLPIPTGIIVGYVQDPKEFKYNDYIQRVESPSVTGTYYTLNRDHPVRVITESDYAWAPGSRAPQAHTNTGSFSLTEFMLDRVAPTFEIDEVAADMAKKFGKWDAIEFEAKVMAMWAAIVRTMRVWMGGAQSPNGLALDTPATWGANTATAAALSGVAGGTFVNAQPTAPVIQPALFEAARRINIGTNGRVKPSDLSVIINPTAAIAIATSQEIRDFVKQQASSPEILKSGWDNPNQLWGLPATLFGFKLIVEDACRVSSAPTDPDTLGTRTYVKADNSACLMARPGGISAPYGSKSFSTVQLFWHKWDMSVEMHQPENGWHKMHEGRVVDYRTIVAPAIESGFQIQNILA
jgi:hypothetical protein